MPKAIGLGGIFIKCENPKEMNAWYKNTLGLNVNDYGVSFEFTTSQNTKGYLQLSTFDKESKYFGNDKQQAMLNFRVDNLEAFIPILKQQKVDILTELESFPYGKFIHIADIDGNRIELWEPVDAVFENDMSAKQPLD